MKESFPKFTSLPTELRILIWRFSLASRIVELVPSRYLKTSFYSPTPPPAILSVSHDSRKAVRQLYAESFGWIWPGRVLFNYQLDTLYLSSSAMKPLCLFLKGILKERELGKLRSVAIDEKLLGRDGYGVGMRRAICAMTELRSMKVVRGVEDVILPRGCLSIFEVGEQVVFLDEVSSKRRAGCLNWTWEERAQEVISEKYKIWTVFPDSVEMELVYEWRVRFLEERRFVCEDSEQWDGGSWYVRI